MCWQIPSVAALRGRQQNGLFANISVQHTCQVFFLAACGPVCHQLEHEAAYLCVSSSRPSGIGSQLTLHSMEQNVGICPMVLLPQVLAKPKNLTDSSGGSFLQHPTGSKYGRIRFWQLQ